MFGLGMTWDASMRIEPMSGKKSVRLIYTPFGVGKQNGIRANFLSQRMRCERYKKMNAAYPLGPAALACVP